MTTALTATAVFGDGTIGIANRAGGVAVPLGFSGFAPEVVKVGRARAFRRGDGTAGLGYCTSAYLELWSTPTAQRERTNGPVE